MYKGSLDPKSRQDMREGFVRETCVRGYTREVVGTPCPLALIF